MISRLITQSEKQLWNDFVMDSPRGHIYQSYEWGEVMSHSGWQPLRLVVEEAENIKACVSILKKKIPATPWSIFYSPRGPIINYQEPETFRCLMEGINRIASANSAVFLQIVPHALSQDNEVSKALNKQNFKKIEKQGLLRLTEALRVYRIDLSNSEDEILAKMKRKTRYSVRLAQRKGVEVKQGKNFADLEVFYNMLKATSKRKKFAVRNFSYFKSIWEQMSPNGIAKLFFSTYKEELLSTAIIFKFGKLCWYMYGASKDKHRDVMASYALQWHIMKWAKKNGCKWYDLRGVPSFNPPKTHESFGIYLFKRGFGGVPHTFAGDFYYIFKRNMYKVWELGEAFINRQENLILKFLHG
jgi:lipid II:glycine glycyltransferase (peptidoglycan interpeptide bridge formation enzyme)